MCYYNIRHSLFLSVFLILTTGRIIGQSAQENLDKGYILYTQFNTEFENRSAPITEAQIQSMTKKADSAMTLFNKAFKEGFSEQKLASSYYNTLINSQHGQIAYEFKAYETAFTDFIDSEAAMAALVKDVFPLKFRIQGEEKVIEFKDFETMRNNHYYYSGVLYFKAKKLNESVKRLSEMISKDNITKEQKYIAYNCFSYAQVLEPTLFDKVQQSYNLLQLIKSNTAVTSVFGKQVFEEKALIKPISAALTLIDMGNETNVSQTTLGHCAEAATHLSESEPINKTVLNLYELCFKKFISDAVYGNIYVFTTYNPLQNFCKKAESYARTMVGVDKQKAEFVGVTATQKMSEYSTENCGQLVDYANDFNFWNKPADEARLRSIAKLCYDNAEKKQKKAERLSRRGDRTINLYAGVYLPYLLFNKTKRDYGGTLDLVVNNTAFELSYLKINQNKENIFDLWINEVDHAEQTNISRWDGYYTHFQTKFFDKKARQPWYVGLLVGYAQKDFDISTIQVTNDATGVVSNATFDPSLKQYIFVLNIGALPLLKGFGVDAFWGFGVNYNEFNAGASINRSEYTINNPLFEYRKDKFYGFMIRLGISAGINFGRGNKN